MEQDRDTTGPRKRTPSTRSVEYFCVLTIYGKPISVEKLEELTAHIFGPLTNFAYFPLRCNNTYFIYARRAKKKRIYDHALVGDFEDWCFECNIINLKDSIVSTMY